MYSMDSGISLSRKGVPKLEGSSPFFASQRKLAAPSKDCNDDADQSKGNIHKHNPQIAPVLQTTESSGAITP